MAPHELFFSLEFLKDGKKR